MNTKRVQLESGGFVEIRLAVNPIKMSVRDRSWLLGLIDSLNEYEQAHPMPPKRPVWWTAAFGWPR